MLRSGEVIFLTEYRGDPVALEQTATEGGNIAIIKGVDIGVQYMGFNLKRKPSNDPAFRRAMALAVNRDLLVQAAWKGEAVKTNSIVSTVLGYWHNAELVSNDLDLEKARQILAGAGYEWVDGKLHYPDGVADSVMAN